MHFRFSFPSYPEHEEWHVCELSQLHSRPHRCTVPCVLAEQQVFQQHLQQRECASEHTAVSCIHSKTILQHPSKEVYIFILRNWRGVCVWGLFTSRCVQSHPFTDFLWLSSSHAQYLKREFCSHLLWEATLCHFWSNELTGQEPLMRCRKLLLETALLPKGLWLHLL